MRGIDFGQVLLLNNSAANIIPVLLGGDGVQTYPALSTAYNSASGKFAVFQAGGCGALGVVIDWVFGAATDMRVRLEGTRDGTKWYAIQSTREDTGVVSYEHTILTTDVTPFILQTTSHLLALKGIRVIGKTTGAPNASDALMAYAVAA